MNFAKNIFKPKEQQNDLIKSNKDQLNKAMLTGFDMITKEFLGSRPAFFFHLSLRLSKRQQKKPFKAILSLKRNYQFYCF